MNWSRKRNKYECKIGLLRLRISRLTVHRSLFCVKQRKKKINKPSNGISSQSFEGKNIFIRVWLMIIWWASQQQASERERKGKTEVYYRLWVARGGNNSPRTWAKYCATFETSKQSKVTEKKALNVTVMQFIFNWSSITRLLSCWASKALVVDTALSISNFRKAAHYDSLWLVNGRLFDNYNRWLTWEVSQ